MVALAIHDSWGEQFAVVAAAAWNAGINVAASNGADASDLLRTPSQFMRRWPWQADESQEPQQDWEATKNMFAAMFGASPHV